MVGMRWTGGGSDDGQPEWTYSRAARQIRNLSEAIWTEGYQWHGPRNNVESLLLLSDLLHLFQRWIIILAADVLSNRFKGRVEGHDLIDYNFLFFIYNMIDCLESVWQPANHLSEIGP